MTKFNKFFVLCFIVFVTLFLFSSSIFAQSAPFSTAKDEFDAKFPGTISGTYVEGDMSDVSSNGVAGTITTITVESPNNGYKTKVNIGSSQNYGYVLIKTEEAGNVVTYGYALGQITKASYLFEVPGTIKYVRWLVVDPNDTIVTNGVTVSELKKLWQKYIQDMVVVQKMQMYRKQKKTNYKRRL